MLDSLTPKELASLYVNLLEFCEAKLTRTQHTDSEGGPLVIKVQHSVSAPTMPLQIENTEVVEAEIIPIKVTDSKKPF
ncbi:MAG: hypothetical protein JST75_14900 [Bacteroidetes bacterium]|nr:hypothetical protein [Bacteroidota bacterium]